MTSLNNIKAYIKERLCKIAEKIKYVADPVPDPHNQYLLYVQIEKYFKRWGKTVYSAGNELSLTTAIAITTDLGDIWDTLTAYEKEILLDLKTHGKLAIKYARTEDFQRLSATDIIKLDVGEAVDSIKPGCSMVFTPDGAVLLENICIFLEVGEKIT